MSVSGEGRGRVFGGGVGKDMLKCRDDISKL